MKADTIGTNFLKDKSTRVAIFASGAGSNAQKIIDYFAGDNKINISLIVCNKPNAGVLKIAASHNIPVVLLEKELFFKGDACVRTLKENNIHLVVLAGFLWKIPFPLIAAYPNKIINIHPALLPKYGGKGMYGHHVHQAVIANGEKESGITIHYVNEHFDEGEQIFQATCPVMPDDTPETLADRIHQLEHAHFAPIIASIVM